jgi:hypothetical protein
MSNLNPLNLLTSTLAGLTPSALSRLQSLEMTYAYSRVRDRTRLEVTPKGKKTNFSAHEWISLESLCASLQSPFQAFCDHFHQLPCLADRRLTITLRLFARNEFSFDMGGSRLGGGASTWPAPSLGILLQTLTQSLSSLPPTQGTMWRINEPSPVRLPGPSAAQAYYIHHLLRHKGLPSSTNLPKPLPEITALVNHRQVVRDLEALMERR